MYLKNKVLGVGPKNFRNLCSNNEYKKKEDFLAQLTHIFYIQLLAEGGTFVFLIFYLFILHHLGFIL